MNTNLPEQYTQDYKYLNNQIEKIQPKWLNEIRNKAFSNLSKIGFPTQRKGNEKWKYTNISKLAKSSFSFESEESPYIPNKNFITNDSDWTNLIFLNGKLLNNISNFQKADNNITISKFTDALKNPKTSQLIKTHLSKYSQVESDGFTSLNTAFINDGILINIHQDTHITKPIHISFISHSNETPTVSYPRILIIANKNSSSNIIESYIGDSKIDSFTNSVSEIVLDDSAKISHYRLLNESDNTYHIESSRVTLKRNSNFESNSFSRSSKLGRYDLKVNIEGENAYCNLSGLYLTSGNQHIDNFINIDHIKPKGTSRLNYKGILTEKSRAVFGGTVWVREGAIHTDSIQSDKNLLLSEEAEVDSKPALFIYADDVQCAHGATAGNIDAETIFYMRSRGIDLETASKLLINGFANEIINNVDIPELKQQLEKLFLESLPKYKLDF
ncbi:MAG: Fe-S cluster assembly protein SufD [Chloroflexi bacterium]|nr:Fe-S cluster assembly protein SufD [Chloroflexota bacterium]|tara:strand:- start:25748 stop:27079 length:1332 start_codon:yes stop_codon:yes gene_type:complete